MSTDGSAAVRMLVGIDPETSADIYEALVDPTDRWNGWLNPLFSRKEAERIVQRMSSAEHGADSIVLAWDGDVVTITSYPGTDEEYVERVEPDAEGGYAIGNYGWCWHEVNIPEGVDADEALRRDSAESAIFCAASNAKNRELIAAGMSANERYPHNEAAGDAAVRAAGGPWRENL